ncbi:TVP38/TMEM64 family protein [Paenibacillus chartarius]|uniref:TVP38/TMEM64 family membrane protein n=1 Tax=Paenibacillus chartarius TaxID=747481 RepID=A0ABV6DJC8_9BACL
MPDGRRRRSPFRSKWLIALVYIGGLAIVLSERDALGEWLTSRDDAGDAVLLFLAAAALALFPVIPFGIVAGVLGAKFGVVTGSIMNIGASVIAAYIMFVFARLSLTDVAERVAMRYRYAERMQQLMKANPFFAVLFARLIPIIPAPVVNVYSGVSGITTAAYVTATVLGKIPVMLVFAIVGDQLAASAGSAALTIIIYGAFLLAVYGAYRLWLRRQA